MIYNKYQELQQIAAGLPENEARNEVMRRLGGLEGDMLYDRRKLTLLITAWQMSFS